MGTPPLFDCCFVLVSLKEKKEDSYWYPQYLAPAIYELTKNNIITWQLLFD